jgi:FkbM family methyltransferase
MASENVRRAQIAGALAGLCVGGIFAFFIGRLTALPSAAFGAPASASAVASVAPADASTPISPGSLPLNSFPEVSFAQQGEDLVIKQIFAELGISGATYLDVGAYDPIKDSNTYLFYALGSHGVLVEPNPGYAAKLRKARPRDLVLEEGIGTTPGQTSAGYYEFAEDEDNTFSKEQADKVVRLGMPIKSVVKMPLASIDDVIAANFGGAAPSLLSIDTEGLDLAILQSLDFHRFRPAVVCVETLEVGTLHAIDAIATYMRQQGYAVRGGTFVNTIFVDEQAIARADVAKPK